ncbi:unnamed protein product [Moneuplotes crassus]|uniref:Uncharacterized protein n=1 Tax=Euplotes crassus TaxID=5936 RepID=A0AAD1XFP2_EUPCR|nr:unnamed protein product [Moneuplotes crassus]
MQKSPSSTKTSPLQSSPTPKLPPPIAQKISEQLNSLISQTHHSKTLLALYNTPATHSHSTRLHQIHQSLLQTAAQLSSPSWASLADQFPPILDATAQLQAEVGETIKEFAHLFCYGATKKKKVKKKRCIKTGKKFVPKDVPLAVICSRELKARENYKKIFTKVENQVYKKTIEFDSQVWSALHENMNSYNFRTEGNDFRPDDKLVIDCRDPSNPKLVKKLQKIPLARLDEVRLIHISQHHPKLAKSILNGLIPTKINHLELRADRLISIMPFMDGFTCANLKVQTRVTLQDFNFRDPPRFSNRRQELKTDEYCLVNFFKAYKHVKDIKLFKCTLDCKDYSGFSKALCKTSIQTLSMEECLTTMRSYWSRRQTGRFEEFIEAISNSDLKQTLRLCLFMDWKEWPREYMIYDLKRLGFGDGMVYHFF